MTLASHSAAARAILTCSSSLRGIKKFLSLLGAARPQLPKPIAATVLHDLLQCDALSLIATAPGDSDQHQGESSFVVADPECVKQRHDFGFCQFGAVGVFGTRFSWNVGIDFTPHGCSRAKLYIAVMTDIDMLALDQLNNFHSSRAAAISSGAMPVNSRLPKRGRIRLVNWLR